MLADARQTISASPIFGDYASYTPGHYAHNILSAWVDLGLFGFVYLLAMLIWPAISMGITGLFSTRNSGEFVLGFALVSVTILLLFKSHYFTDMLIGAVLGAYCKYNYERKHARRSPSVARSAAAPSPQSPYPVAQPPRSP
jgi:hypothetical protein